MAERFYKLLISFIFLIITGGVLIWQYSGLKREIRQPTLSQRVAISPPTPILETSTLIPTSTPEALSTEKCRDISDRGRQSKCYLDSALKTGDFQLCDEIRDRIIKVQCHNELAIKLNKPEKCYSSECLIKLAIKNKDVKVCGKIIYDFLKTTKCVVDFAAYYTDFEACKIMPQIEPNMKGLEERCYIEFGSEVGKKGSCELCENIPNELGRKICLLRVTANLEKGFCENLKVKIEDLVGKYIDEEFGFSFYYPKKFQVSKVMTERGKTIVLWESGASPEDYRFAPLSLSKHYGKYVEDSDTKFGNVAYYFDEYKNQWMLDYDSQLLEYNPETNDYRGIVPAQPKFYTLTGLPVFRGVGRWGTDILALSTHSFLIINAGGNGELSSLVDPLTKTVARIDQKIGDKELKNALVDVLLSVYEIDILNLIR